VSPLPPPPPLKWNKTYLEGEFQIMFYYFSTTSQRMRHNKKLIKEQKQYTPSPSLLFFFSTKLFFNSKHNSLAVSDIFNSKWIRGKRYFKKKEGGDFVKRKKSN